MIADERKSRLPRTLPHTFIVWLTMALAAFFAVVLGYWIAEGENFLLLLTVCLCAGAFFLLQPKWAAFACIALCYSSITAPVIPGMLDCYYISIFLLIGIFWAHKILGQKGRIRWDLMRLALGAFALLILVTGSIRGMGFRAFEGSGGPWGGMYYVQLLCSISLIFIMPYFSLSPPLYRAALVLMGVLSVTPAAAEFLIYQGANIQLLWNFVHVSSQTFQMLGAMQNFSSTIRLISAGQAGVLLTIAFLAVVPTRLLFGIVSFPLWLVPIGCMTLAAISGFRLAIGTILMVLFFTLLLQRTLTPLRACFLFLGVAGAYVFLVACSTLLPEGIQRAVSWVPGVHVLTYVQQDATGTVDWRMELWRRALLDWKKYALVGKGFSFDSYQLTHFNPFDQDAIFNSFISYNNYHNGPINLLLTLGIPGLVLGFFLLGAILWRHLRVCLPAMHDPLLRRLHQVVLAWLITDVFTFLFIYGDTQLSFPLFFFHVAVLESFYQADRTLAANPAEKTE